MRLQFVAQPIRLQQQQTRLQSGQLPLSILPHPYRRRPLRARAPFRNVRIGYLGGYWSDIINNISIKRGRMTVLHFLRKATFLDPLRFWIRMMIMSTMSMTTTLPLLHPTIHSRRGRRGRKCRYCHPCWDDVFILRAAQKHHRDDRETIRLSNSVRAYTIELKGKSKQCKSTHNDLL